MTVTCGSCGKLSPEGVLCILCGAYLKPPVQCPRCGRSTASHIKKCPYCNAEIVAVQTPPPVPCVKCGRKIAAHLEICQMCGAPQSRTVPAAAPRAPAPAAPPSTLEELIAFVAAAGPTPNPQVDQALERIKAAPTRPTPAAAAASLLSKRGAKAALEKRHDEALLLLDRSLALDPDNAVHLALKANALFQSNRIGEALSCAERALLIDPKNVQARFIKTHGNPEASSPEERLKQQGFAFQRDEKHAEALGCFDQVLARAPRDSEALAFKGLSLMQLKRYDEALKSLDEAIAIDRLNLFAWLTKAPVLDFLGRKAESDACVGRAGAIAKADKAQDLFNAKDVAGGFEKINQALADDATYDLAWFGKGSMLERTGKFQEALPCFEKAVALNPKLPSAWKGLAGCLVRFKRFEEALRAAERCLEQKPGDWEVRLYTGIAYESLNRKQEALEAYSQFLKQVPLTAKDELSFARQHLEAVKKALRPVLPKLPPTSAEAPLNRAYALRQKGALQDAARGFEEALRMDPYCTAALLNQGACLEQLGRPEDALKLFDRAVKMTPKLPGAWVMRATSLAALDRQAEALESLDKALELDPYETTAWQNKGACLNAQQRREEALSCLDRALLLDPFNIIGWYNKAGTEQVLQRKEAALASLKRFLEMAPDQVEDLIEDARRRIRELESGETGEATLTLPSKPVEILGNRYQIYKTLGRGGFGVVYLAVVEDKAGGKEDVYALKTFLDERARDPETVELFKKEARAWIALDRHPHLVRAYYVDEVNGRLFIAMEFIMPGPEGQNTLEGYLRHRPPGLNQSLRWAIQFCYGMEHAYTKGIRCHRDIKPANIMIDSRKVLKISDFGLAGALPPAGTGPAFRAMPSEVGLALPTMDGGGAGTPTHMPPEQWRSAAACDERSDLYAFGVTMYQMAAKGKLPYLAPLPRDTSPQEQQRFLSDMHRLHATAAPPPLASPLWPLIERCLQKDPRSRYPSFAALRADLEPLLKGQAQGEIVPPPKIEALETQERINKALSLESLNRLDEAAAEFDAILQADPRSAEAWAGKAVCLSRKGRHAEALALFDRALGIDPALREIWANKGNTLQSLGRYADAVASYDQAIGLDPSNPTALRNKATALIQLGRHAEADQVLQQAMALEPDNAYGWISRGQILRESRKFEDAVAAFRRAAQIQPQLPQAWSLQGEALNSLGRHAEALPCFQRALEIDPSDVLAWTNRGGCLASAGRPDEALACYDKAISINPRTAMAWNNKGNLLAARRQNDEAMACFDRALEAEPDHMLAIQNKSLQLRERGRMDEALALVERGLRFHPGSSNLWYFKGEFLMKLGRFEPALAAYERVLQTEKSNARALGMAHCHIGECFEKLGRGSQALAAFQKASGLLRDYKEALAGMDRCRGKGGGPP